MAIKLTLLNSSSFEQLQLASERLNPFSIVYTDQHNLFRDCLDLILTFLSRTKTRIKILDNKMETQSKDRIVLICEEVKDEGGNSFIIEE